MEKNKEVAKFDPYDLGQVAKHLRVHRGPKIKREILPGGSPYDLSTVKVKKIY